MNPTALPVHEEPATTLQPQQTNQDGSVQESVATSPPRQANEDTPLVYRRRATDRAMDASIVRPWIRLWARSFDVLLVAIPLFLWFWSWQGTALLAWLPLTLFVMLALFIWLIIEPACVWLFKTTPGKWLFSIRVTTAEGQPLSYQQALRRSDMLWAKGMGAGAPVLGQALMIFAHYQLSSQGKTFWDEQENLLVWHGRVRRTRLLFGLLVLIFIFAGLSWLLTPTLLLQVVVVLLQATLMGMEWVAQILEWAQAQLLLH